MSDSLKKAELSAQNKINSALLESEKKYLKEKERLKKEEATEEEAIRQKEYEERLASAKNNLSVEKATRNETLRLQKKANEEYLAQLQEAARQEREILKQLKSDVKDIYDDILSFAEEHIIETAETRSDMEDKLKNYGKLTKKVIFKGAAPDGGD